MARGRSSQPPTRSFPKLTVLRKEAQSRIETQIERGNEIKSLRISKEEELKNARNEYYKWDNFNTDLLRRLFDSEEISANYSAWYGIIAGGRQPLHEEIKDHLGDIDDKIHKLESIKERLPLYDEPVQAAHQQPMTMTVREIKRPRRIFISHGRSTDWQSVQAYIEKDLGIATLELAQEANRGRTVLQKLWDESSKCSFAVVVMTGDDDIGTGQPRARENVLHEIGFFQGKFGLENVCLLYEEETSIPSNIHGLVYISFPKGIIKASFGELQRELRAAFTE
ncbi:MAG: TIR domain-containing protein [Blastocatellia bacterium]